MDNTEVSKENVKNVLLKIDKALAKRGIEIHQERLMRIYKTVNAVEKHSNCFVSKFQIEDDGHDSDELHFRTFEEVNKPSLNLLTDLETKKVQFEFEDEDPKKTGFKIGMEELLAYVEDELGFNGGQDSDSSSGDKNTDSSQIGKDDKIPRNKEIDKRFHNIELKLRSFIKENETYDIFSKATFKSFVDDQRLKTPGSLKSKGKEFTTPITYNFFEEKDVIEVCQKRWSQNQQTLKNNLEKFAKGLDKEDLTTGSKFATNINFKARDSTVGKPKGDGKHNSISKFCADFGDNINVLGEDGVEKNSFPKLKHHSFTIEKRGSIFTDMANRIEDVLGIQEKHSEDEDERSENSSPNKSPRSDNSTSPRKIKSPKNLKSPEK
jgi:hypothetical protein